MRGNRRLNTKLSGAPYTVLRDCSLVKRLLPLLAIKFEVAELGSQMAEARKAACHADDPWASGLPHCHEKHSAALVLSRHAAGIAIRGRICWAASEKQSLIEMAATEACTII